MRGDWRLEDRGEQMERVSYEVMGDSEEFVLFVKLPWKEIKILCQFPSHSFLAY